jgi:hypothetical protein
MPQCQAIHVGCDASKIANACAIINTQKCHTGHTSHVTRHTSHVTRHTSHVTRHTSHVTRHTSHVTRHTSKVTSHTSHVKGHTSHVTRHTSASRTHLPIWRWRYVGHRRLQTNSIIQGRNGTLKIRPCELHDTITISATTTTTTATTTTTTTTTTTCTGLFIKAETMRS